MSNLEPVARAERIETMDVLRGFALLGILLMNIVGMGLPISNYMNPAATGAPSAADLNTWFITNTFFEGSMRTLFSMLFGAGFVLLLTRLEQRGLSGAKIYMRRMALLMLLGLIDIGVLLWRGDILFSYGIAGMLLLLFWGSRLRGLVVWAVLIFALIALFNLGGGEKFAGMQAARDRAMAAQGAGQTLSQEQAGAIRSWDSATAFWQPGEAKIREEIQTYRKGWLAVAGDNLGQIFGKDVGFFAFLYIFDPLAAMLLGMIAFRLGLLQGRWSIRSLLALTFVCFAIGLPVNYLETQAIIASNFSIHGFFAALPTYDVGRVSLAGGWLGLVLLACKAPWLAWLRAALGAVGRMALTNYLLHSIMAAILFVGLGWFGTLSRAELYFVVVAFWALNIVFSLAWLSVFRIGPFEWLWRAGTYGRWPPLLRDATQAAAAAPSAG